MSVAGDGVAARPGPGGPGSSLSAAELRAIAAQFPVLRRRGSDGRPIVYLDSAASSQTPQPVIDAITEYYTTYRASVHRGVYPLIEESTERFEGARTRIADWLGSSPEETIFTANASAALNLVAQSWGRANLEPGDAVLVTEMEHHSNLVPWQLICAERGAELRYIPVSGDGLLDLDAYDALLAAGDVRLVAVAHVSNVLGTVNPVREIVARAHDAGAVAVVDGAQAVPQLPVDLREIGADFYAWTGHKLYGPTGVGVLHGRRDLLEAMPPFISGGHMIRQVFETSSTWAELPGKFEAGTSPIAEAIGLGAAVDWVREIGIEEIHAHEHALTVELLDRLSEVPGLHIHGPLSADARGGLISFDLDGAHPHDIGEILGREDVCVRTGHHCAQPLMRRLGIGASTRASLAIHNSSEDIDRLIDGLGSVRRILELP